ncbi:MAG: hypothetical protein KDC26_08710 [Armatimonadetes bacterium]|nr:hypothetical protein [Armatimonadota bacterium]
MNALLFSLITLTSQEKTEIVSFPNSDVKLVRFMGDRPRQELRYQGKSLDWKLPYGWTARVGQTGFGAQFDGGRVVTSIGAGDSKSRLQITQTYEFADPSQVKGLRYTDAFSGSAKFNIIPNRQWEARFGGWPVVDKPGEYGFVSASKRVPPHKLAFSYEIDLNPGSEPLSDLIWKENLTGAAGEDLFMQPAPQMVPFQHYAAEIVKARFFPQHWNEVGYPGEITKDRWWRGEVNGVKVAAPAGSKTARFTRDENSMLPAIGLHYWGTKMKQGSWQVLADQIARLAMTTPPGRIGGEFDLLEKKWKIGTTDDEAATAFWMFKYAGLTTDEALAADLIKSAREAHSRMQGSNRTPAQMALASLFGEKPQIKPLSNGDLAGWTWAILADPTVDADRAFMALQNQNPTDPRHFGLIGPQARPWNTYSILGSFALALNGQARERDMLIKRGVLGIRATFAQGNLIAENSELGFGTESVMTSYMCEAGTDLAGKPSYRRESTDGALLGVLALFDLSFGSVYRSQSGNWIPIDAIARREDGHFANLLLGNVLPYATGVPHTTSVDAKGTATKIEVDRGWPTIAFAEPHLRDQDVYLIASPGNSLTGNEPKKRDVSVVFGTSRSAMKAGARGFETKLNPATLPKENFLITGELDGYQIQQSFDILLSPPEKLDVSFGPRGWTRSGGLDAIGCPTLYANFDYILSTADNKTGGRSALPAGTITSAQFFGYKGTVSFDLMGEGENSVQLWDMTDRKMLRSDQPEKGKSNRVEWELDLVPGHMLQIRLVDAGPGYVEITRMKVSG